MLIEIINWCRRPMLHQHVAMYALDTAPGNNVPLLHCFSHHHVSLNLLPGPYVRQIRAVIEQFV